MGSRSKARTKRSGWRVKLNQDVDRFGKRLELFPKRRIKRCGRFRKYRRLRRKQHK